jgi:uncharacterized protein
MNCPVCNVDLKTGDRQGVEVNYCPTCRGVWIERGGLDKIIDRATAAPSRPAQDSERGRDQSRDYSQHDRHGDHGHEGQRRKSFLSNLFD